MQIKIQKSFFLTALPLLLVLFIDGMGLGLAFPLLNTLLANTNTHIFSSNLINQSPYILFGLVIGIFMLCWFFGAAILGNLSDQVGRKKSLLICLFGAFLGYLLSALAVTLHSLSLLIIGRMIAGFTAGSQPIAQAAIIDISEQEHKARNIGLIMLFISLGFIIGPLIGGLLSNQNLLTWFNLATPFYFAAFISLLNLFLLHYFFKETFSQTKELDIKPHHAIEIFISAFRNEKVKKLSFIFFIFMLGWSSCYSFISLLLAAHWNFNTNKISIFMALLGVGFGIGNFLLDYLTKNFSLNNTTIVSLLMASISILPMVICDNPSWAWSCAILLGTSIAVAYAVIVTIFSNQVDANSQGWVMGITGSIAALVFAADAFIGGFLASWHSATPLILGIVCLMTSALLMHFFYSHTEQR